MSWQPRIITTKDSKSRREDYIDLEALKADEDAIAVAANRFICPKCGEGWTFSRMKSVVCTGNDKVRHRPITYYKDNNND